MSSDIAPRRLTVIDYGAGNLRSVVKMASRLGADVRVSSNAADIEWAERLILPGVGAFPDAMQKLKSLGLVEPLDAAVAVAGKPLLGICLGMELLARESEEIALTRGFGWIDAGMVGFSRMKGIRVPHVGWNRIKIVQSCPLLSGVDDLATFYFVHSYYMECVDRPSVVATSQYGCTFPAVVRRGAIFGTQFHPEKSQANGALVLQNFIGGDLV